MACTTFTGNLPIAVSADSDDTGTEIVARLARLHREEPTALVLRTRGRQHDLEPLAHELRAAELAPSQARAAAMASWAAWSAPWRSSRPM